MVDKLDPDELLTNAVLEATLAEADPGSDQDDAFDQRMQQRMLKIGDDTRYVEYVCSNPTCKGDDGAPARDWVKYAVGEPTLAVINCWSCHYGYNKKVEFQLNKQVGMFPVMAGEDAPASLNSYDHGRELDRRSQLQGEAPKAATVHAPLTVTAATREASVAAVERSWDVAWRKVVDLRKAQVQAEERKSQPLDAARIRQLQNKARR